MAFCFFSINNLSRYISEDIQRALTPGRKGSRWTCVHKLAALQKCRCAKSIFNVVVPAACSPAKRSLSVLLHFRSVAIEAKWWCQSRGIGIIKKKKTPKKKNTTPPPVSTEITVGNEMEKSVQLASPPPFNYASPRAERTLASRTKYAERNTLVYTGS